MIRYQNIPTGIAASAALPDIRINTDEEYLDVIIEAVGVSGGDADAVPAVLHTARYWAAGGLVTVSDIADIVEPWMRGRGATIARVRLSATGYDQGEDPVTAEIRVLYCDRLPFEAGLGRDMAPWLSSHFLTTARVRSIAPDGTMPLVFYLDGPDCDVTTEAACRFLSGRGSQTVSFTERMTSDDGIYILDIDAAAIHDRAAALLVTAGPSAGGATSGLPGTAVDPDDLGEPFEVVSVTVAFGDRRMTIYVDKVLSNINSPLSTLKLRFRNVFNVEEVVAVPAATTAKTEAEASEAVIGRTAMQYDRQTSVAYESETCGLSDDECHLMSQAAASHCVRRILPSVPEGAPVLVTDCTCEVPELPAAPPSFKIKWRYADTNPRTEL